MFIDLREGGREVGAGERDKEREGEEGERETLIGCLPYATQPGIEPTT